MSLTQVIPASYGYVGLAVASTGFLTLWQGLVVGRHRRAAKIDYPQVYATPEQQKANPAALKYNCAQRAHANTLENLLPAIFGTVYTGLLYPRFAAAALAIWVAGRVVYTLGYTTGDPKKRSQGFFMYLGFLPLLFGPLYTSYRIITEGLI